MRVGKSFKATGSAGGFFTWECRDCALLDDNEYHDKLEQAWDF
jgi:hypothetical protein